MTETVLLQPKQVFARYNSGRNPYVIWKIEKGETKVKSVLGSTRLKAMPHRWIRAEGNIEDNGKYGEQLKFYSAQIPLTPFHEAVARAIAVRIKPYRSSNELAIVKWLVRSKMPSDVILKIWKGDTAAIRSYVPNDVEEEKIKDVLLDLAADLDDDVYDRDYMNRDNPIKIKTAEWWRYLCWASLFGLRKNDAYSIFHLQKLDPDDLKKDPYLILQYRGIEDMGPTEYIKWFDYVDYVSRFLKAIDKKRRGIKIVHAAVIFDCYNEHSTLTTRERVMNLLNSGEFYMEDFNPREFGTSKLTEALDALDGNTLHLEDDSIYLIDLYDYESRTASMVSDRMQEPEIPVDVAAITKVKEKVLKVSSGQVDFTDDQIRGIYNSLSHKVSTISGLPGTGKTKTLQGIVEYCKEKAVRVAILAPTGIAAKNASIATRHEASTIHRYLGYDGDTWRYLDSEYAESIVMPSVLIVDESSMLSMELLYRIFDFAEEHTRVVLVGDPGQIPSISPGSGFKQILSAGLPGVSLTKIHRQAQNSGIIRLAHDIIHDTIKPFKTYDPEVRWEPIKSWRDVMPALMRSLPNINSPGELLNFQVITPTNIGPLGTERLNSKLADRLNNGERSFIGFKGFSQGDKVIITKNNYDSSTFNGDTGLIAHFNHKDKKDPTIISIMGKNDGSVAFNRSTMGDEVNLGYAITIHRGQGSEWDEVILVVDPTHNRMIYRNLLFTAVTRAKKKLTIISSEKDFRELAAKSEDALRWTKFANRIRGQS